MAPVVKPTQRLFSLNPALQRNRLRSAAPPTFAYAAEPRKDELDRSVTAFRAHPAAGRSTWLGLLTDPVRLNVVGALLETPEASAAELLDRSQTSSPTLRRRLEAMKTLGLVEELAGESDGRSPGRPASRFRLSPQARERAEAVFAALNEPLRPSR